jgi:hypothetical protein
MTIITRLRRNGQYHALYLALSVVIKLCAVIGVVSAHQSHSGTWLAIFAISAVLALSAAIHHSTKVMHYADLLEKERIYNISKIPRH